MLAEHIYTGQICIIIRQQAPHPALHWYRYIPASVRMHQLPANTVEHQGTAHLPTAVLPLPPSPPRMPPPPVLACLVVLGSRTSAQAVHWGPSARAAGCSSMPPNHEAMQLRCTAGNSIAPGSPRKARGGALAGGHAQQWYRAHGRHGKALASALNVGSGALRPVAAGRELRRWEEAD